MKIKSIFLIAILLLTSIRSFSADTSRVQSSSLLLGLGNDSYYGLYFYALGFFNYKKKITPAIFVISRSMQGGAGIRYAPTKYLSIIPVLGIINGKALSGATSPKVAEGTSLSLFTNYDNQKIYLDEGLLFYKCIRKRGPVTVDYLWYWLTGGIRFNRFISGGAHFEHLIKTRSSDGKDGMVYRYIGPYIQVSLASSINVRLTTGFQGHHPDLIRINISTGFR
jgi:hypothetical protein